jgi:hypothetical protein
MFLRIIERGGKKETVKSGTDATTTSERWDWTTDTLIECDSVKLGGWNEISTPEKMLVYTETKSGQRIYEVCKGEGTEMYIMNHEGKTIDSYRW